MVHQGQGLPLGLEAGDHLAGVHSRLDDLHGDLAADRLPLLGHVDHGHAPFADLLQELVTADGLAGSFGHGGFVQGGGEMRAEGSLQKVLGFGPSVQQLLHPKPKVSVIPTCRVEVGFPIVIGSHLARIPVDPIDLV